MSSNSDSDFNTEDINTESEYSDSSDYSNENSDMDDFIEHNNNDYDTLNTEEYKNLINKLREPKLHLNPNLEYNNGNKKATNFDNLKFNSEVERLRWVIKNKLGPNTTLKEYIEYLESQK